MYVTYWPIDNLDQVIDLEREKRRRVLIQLPLLPPVGLKWNLENMFYSFWFSLVPL